jgi:hypothetical protein
LSRARELTLGSRRGRVPSDPRAAELNKLARAKRIDLERLSDLIDDVAHNSPRSLTGALSMAWELARVRYARETGVVKPGPHNPYLEMLRRDSA